MAKIEKVSVTLICDRCGEESSYDHYETIRVHYEFVIRDMFGGGYGADSRAEWCGKCRESFFVWLKEETGI